jgi:hypothetical protein
MFRKQMLLLSTSAVALILAGCGTMTALNGSHKPPVVVRDFCLVSRPILWADADTDDTIRQSKEHNARWVALCGDKSK